MEGLEKAIVLAIIDQYWKEHLRNMDDLRSNVQLARFEQKDPLLIYKFESYELFKGMVQRMNAEVAAFLLKCTIPTGPGQQPVKQAPAPRLAASGKVNISKEGVQNMQQQALASARQASGTGAGSMSLPRPKMEPIRTEKKVLPNEPCPCGSGKKFKKCHGG